MEYITDYLIDFLSKHSAYELLLFLMNFDLFTLNN